MFVQYQYKGLHTHTKKEEQQTPKYHTQNFLSYLSFTLTKHVHLLVWYRSYVFFIIIYMLLMWFFSLLICRKYIFLIKCIFLHSMCTHACKFHLMISQQIFSSSMYILDRNLCSAGENSRGYGMWRVWGKVIDDLLTKM